jgi:hypothetical protein
MNSHETRGAGRVINNGLATGTGKGKPKGNATTWTSRDSTKLDEAPVDHVAKPRTPLGTISDHNTPTSMQDAMDMDFEQSEHENPFFAHEICTDLDLVELTKEDAIDS